MLFTEYCTDSEKQSGCQCMGCLPPARLADWERRLAVGVSITREDRSTH